MSKELGRKEIALIIERMLGADANNTLETLKFIPPAVAEALGEELKRKRDAGEDLSARLEYHHLGVFEAKILPAETKKVRNPKTGETFEKHYKRRVEVKFKTSDIVAELIENHIDIERFL